MDRGENEKPVLVGLALEPKEKEGVLVAVAPDDVEAGTAAGLPKLKLGRAGVVVGAEDEAADDVEEAEMGDAPLLAGLNGLAVLFTVLPLLEDVAVDAVEEAGAAFSTPSRCLRYWSRNDSTRRVRSAKGSASSCSLIF